MKTTFMWRFPEGEKLSLIIRFAPGEEKVSSVSSWQSCPRHWAQSLGQVMCSPLSHTIPHPPHVFPFCLVTWSVATGDGEGPHT